VTDLDDLPAALALEIDALCDDFERHWRRARRRGTSLPDIGAFLMRATHAARATLAACLHQMEQELCAGLTLAEIPGYAVEEEIGRGGMGVVYRARRMEDGQAVALKLIPGAEHARWSRWLAELADLRHPNLVRLEAFGAHEGLHYVVMPLVAGGDLRERFSEFAIGSGAGREQLRVVASLIGKVAGAVGFLHRRGLMHCDVKPSNILLASADDPEPLVCDFGLAGRLDATGAESPCVVGTPAYMAPEQREGLPLTAAADVWGVGAVLHELLTGRPPGPGGHATSTGNGVVKDVLDCICLRCLERDPAARYATAEQLAEDIQRYLDEPSIHLG
jgi:serine/threonine-protein kinase